MLQNRKPLEASVVLNGILERLEPQFHLIENANETRGQPLLSIEQQAYYFRLCASAAEDLLEAQEVSLHRPEHQ